MEANDPNLKTQALNVSQVFPWEADKKTNPTAGADPFLHGTLADFEIIREIGHGGMGTVFVARQRSTSRMVAVKILTRSTALHVHARKRFQREIHALARLNHPNIVPIYAAGEDTGCLFYAMELIDGEALDTYAARKNFSIHKILTIFLKVCHGVSAAHQAGIIHRDLKPSNILVDSDGQPRIVDLGLAKFIDEEEPGAIQTSMTAAYVGTPAFMAPEQCGEGGGIVDTRTDVYSLGVLLYLLLLGSLPYPVPNDPLKAIHCIRTRAPTPPRKLEPSIPVDLATVVLKALSKLPGQRYGSVADFAADIENILAQRPVAARAPTRLYIARKFVCRNWGRLLFSAVWLILFLSVIAVAFSRVEAARREAVRERDIALQARQGEHEARRAQAREAYYKTISIVQQRLLGGRLRDAAKMLRSTPAGARGWEWGRLLYLAKPERFAWELGGTVVKIQPLRGGETTVVHHGKRFSCLNSQGQVMTSTAVPDNIGAYAISPADGTVLWVEEGTATIKSIQFQSSEKPVARAMDPHVFESFSLRPDPKLAFDAQGRFLMIVQSPEALLFSWPDLSLVRRVPTQSPSGQVIAGSVSRTGKMAWIEDGSVSPQLVVECIGPSKSDYRTVDDQCRLLASRKNGRFVAVGTDTRVVFRDAKYGHYTPKKNGGMVDHLCFSPDGAWLAMRIGGVVYVHAVVLPDPESVAELGESTFQLADEGITALAFSADSSTLLAGDAGGHVRGFSIAHGPSHTHWVQDSILSASENNVCRIRGGSLVIEPVSPESGSSVLLRPNLPPVQEISFSASGERLAMVARRSPVIELYDTRTARCRCLVVPCNTPAVHALMSGDGNWCLVTDQHGDMTLFDAVEGKMIRDWVGKTSDPYAISRDGGKIVFGRENNSISLMTKPWNHEPMTVPIVGVQAACFSKDARFLALAREADVIIVDAQTGEQMVVLQPLEFSGVPGALTFCPCGTRLVVGEKQGASVWNPATGYRLLRNIGPSGAVVLNQFLENHDLLLGTAVGDTQVLKVLER